MDNIKAITVDPSLYNHRIKQLMSEISRLKEENTRLKIQNEYERKLRTEAEQKLMNLGSDSKRTRSTKVDIEDKKEEMLALREQKMSVAEIADKLDLSSQTVSKELSYVEQSDMKINGVKKASAMDSIKSYDDFKAIQQYYLNKNQIRNYAFWTMGVALGLRVSDLVNLKYKNFLNEDNTFKQRIYAVEKKTRKAQSCLITEAIMVSLTKYLDIIKWDFSMEDRIFNFSGNRGYQIIREAADYLNISYNLGTHGMRKSFATIAACVDDSTVDMNTITKMQGLLNHSDQKCTMRYLGTFQDMYDRARQSVSDFILGKTDVNELVVNSNNKTTQALDLLEKIWGVVENFEV